MNDSLGAVLQVAKSNGKILALVATIAVLLTRTFSKKSPLVRDLHRVGLVEGRSKTSGKLDDSEYDIIIIGGGNYSIMRSAVPFMSPSRNCRLRACLSSF